MGELAGRVRRCTSGLSAYKAGKERNNMALFKCDACRWIGANPVKRNQQTWCPKCDSYAWRMESNWSWVKHTPEELIPEDVPTGAYLTVMLNDLSYGGPEEGGWWYHVSGHVEHHLISSPRVLDAVRERIARLYSNVGRRPVSSVLSEGEYSFTIGNLPDAGYPDRMPNYE
jgi:hypothetical protein